MGNQGSPATAKPVPAIISPAIDLLLVGGLSLLFFVPLLASGATDLLMVGVGTQALLATAINMPHFMASYRIVYRSKAMILRHKWAAIWVPAIMLVYVAFAIVEAQNSTVLVTIFVTISGAYLAWHYTGQVWGMMASYAFLSGTAFDKTERLLIRTGLRILLAWHVTWFLYTKLRDPDPVRGLFMVVSAGTIVAFILGIVGLVRMKRRTGVLPPARAIVAWLAIFAWYAVVAKDARAIFWVQLAHALQYLAFPWRVEVNTARAAHPDAPPNRVAGHMLGYAVALLVVSYLAGEFLPARAMDAVGLYFGEEPGKVTPVLILMFINIHHYFTDGVIWKISNPEVRKELFAHVQAPRREGGTGQAGEKRK